MTTNSTIVRRVSPFHVSSIRAAANEGDPIGFVGNASVFNERTFIGSKRWGFWEEIAPEAFDATLRDDGISARFLYNHNSDLLLSTQANGTLRLAATKKALSVDADMAPTTWARDLAVLLNAGEVRGMSFGFAIDAYEHSYVIDADGVERSLYRVTACTLYEVSACGDPAYVGTDAALRSARLTLAATTPADRLRSVLDEAAISLAPHELDFAQRTAPISAAELAFHRRYETELFRRASFTKGN